MSVWEKLMSEGSDACKADASKYINECAASALSDIMSEEDLPVVDDAEGVAVPEDGQTVVTVYYQDPDGSCDYDDDIISASGKDDLDAAGWGKGLRVLNFIYDSAEDAAQASAQMSDVAEVPGLVVSSTEDGPDEVAAPVDGEVSVEEVPVDGDSEIEVDEETSEEKNTIAVKFKSDGDETAVDEFKEHGFDIKSTDVDEEGNRVIVLGFGSEEEANDAKAVVKDVLRGLGIMDYTLDSDENTEEQPVEEAEEDTTSAAPTDVSATIDSLEADIAALRAALEADGIEVSSDEDDDSSFAALEESFAGFEPVGKSPACELNSKTGFGSEEGESPVFSRPIKSRTPDGEPIEVKATLTGDGTKLETAPTVKDLPPTKNVIKRDTQDYSKVGKENSAKLNSKEGFGEDGKQSVID